MSEFGSLEKLWDGTSLDELFNEFSGVAKRSFEEEGFDPESVLQMMDKFEKATESEWAAVEAAAEEQLRCANDELNRVMDLGMAELDYYTIYGNAQFEKVSKFEKATQAMANKITAAAAVAANKYIDAAVASAAAAYAANAANKIMRSHFFGKTRVHSVS